MNPPVVRFAITGIALLTAGCARDDVALHFVGSAACGECHAAALALVAGGAHPLAMQPVTEASVLGDFEDAELTHFGAVSQFRRDGGRWLVRTVGSDGTHADFEITHTLGIHPLQQYAVRFPDGRYQVLPLAWDTRAAGEGGQRWFHMYPDEAIPHTDELHWTGPLHNWNYMCAECHVTGLSRNFDPQTNRYDTAWEELGVGCEGCHGPGSGHVAWARASERDSVRANARHGPNAGLLVGLGTRSGEWRFEGAAPIARRTAPLGWNAQTETCGMCHARRETLVAGYRPGRPLLATHRPVLLDEGLYYPDGQMLDEVYEYGSFLQSRMHRAGVTCSDCHHPSTQEVAPGNDACAKCHRPATYDTPAHHFHTNGSAGASCVACHMPPRTYMVVDPRHDHSIRNPRPDLSLKIGTPNACTTCHADRTDAWAARIVEERYGGPPEGPHYGEVIHAGRTGRPGADVALARLATDMAEPGIVRATAVSLLNRFATPVAARGIEVAAADAEPLVRLAAAAASDVLPPELRVRAIAHLVADSLLAIRVEAARVLADVTPDQLPAAHRAAARAAADEFVDAQLVNAERPESHVRLGVFELQRGRLDRAEHHYRDAIRLGPRYAGGYVNLADIYRHQGREREAEQVLRDGLGNAVQPAALHHSLGLLLVRARRLDAALVELATATELEPQTSRFAHVYAVALHTMGRTPEAVHVLEQAIARSPGDAELQATLASLTRIR